MKPEKIILTILAAAIVSSCSSYYYVTTDVNRNMSVERMVYSETSEEGAASDFLSQSVWMESSVDKPFVVDFYDKLVTMGKLYDASAPDISELSFQPAPDQNDNPLFSPEETLDKRFRWFYTYYDYKAVFKSLKERLPLAFDGYITSEQRSLFFNGQNAPEGWNGMEMYYLLDDVNTKFAEWYSDAVFFVLRDIFKPYCSESQAAVLGECKAEFMKDMDRAMVFVMEPDDFTARLDEIYPEAGFDKVYYDNEEQLKSAYEKEAVLISYFGYSFVYTMNLPGKYYEGNAVDFIEGNPSWKMDAFRLLDGDVEFQAVSRKLNVWAFVITFAFIILLLQIFAKLFSKD